MVAALARFMIGLIGFTSCVTAASENASDTRRGVEMLGSPASFRGFINSAFNLEHSAAALDDVDGAAETEASGAWPSGELEEASAEATLLLNANVAGSVHRDSQELPTRVEANVVDHQDDPIVSFNGTLVRHPRYKNDTGTCEDAESTMRRDAKNSMWNHLLANAALYIDASRDHICNDTTTVLGSRLGKIISGSYNQSHACRQAWRNRYGRSPSEFFIELLETRCIYSYYRCKVICFGNQYTCKGCCRNVSLGRMRVECPFRIVYL